MNAISIKLIPVLLSTLTVIVTASCASRDASEADDRMPDVSDSDKQGMAVIKLDGSHEVPPVNTTASANGAITVSADKSIHGNIMTRGMVGVSAHIHEGAIGTNGPIIISLEKNADNTWTVPTGAMLTDRQYVNYMSGNLYVNVHSAAYPNGEIRTQLNPNGRVAPIAVKF